MSQRSDWFPTTRDAIIALAIIWITLCTLKRILWGIPAVAVTELTEVKDAAVEALALVKDKSTRTPVTVARCKAAFAALKAFMRDFKRRFFICPPLTDEDIVALGLKPHDAHPTPSGKPTAHAMVEVSLAGQNQLGLKFVYVSGDPNDPANKSFRVAYLVVGPGEAPPTDPEQLIHSFSTKRKTELMEFPFADSGKRVFICVRLENGREVGGWGPIVSAVIP